METIKNIFYSVIGPSCVTIKACAQQKMQTGLLKGMAEHFVRLIQFVVFVLLWKGFSANNADMGGFTLAELLAYTLLSFVLRRQLDIISPATSMMWEGSIVGRYTRPVPVFSSFVAETIGKQWVPYFCYFSLPVLLVSMPLGISILPANGIFFLCFLLSLCFSVLLGFAIDLIFAAFAIRLKNGMFMATQIREAVYALFSGALIPFSMFPTWAQKLLTILPFGSVASAPLTIYVGKGSPCPLLLLQLFWVIVLAFFARWAYKKSEEEMVSYGG